MMKSRSWKIILIGLVAILALVGAGVFAYGNEPLYTSNVRGSFEEYEGFKKVETLTQTGYEVEGNQYVAMTEDPQMYFQYDQPLNAVGIKFQEPLEQDINIHLFYDVYGAGLNERDSLSVSVQAGETEVVFVPPCRTYSDIRLDIGNEEEVGFVLEGVYFDSQHSGVNPVLFIQSVVMAVILFGVLVMIIYGIKHRKEVMGKAMYVRTHIDGWLSVKRVAVFVLVVYALLVLLQVNLSSMQQYNRAIPHNIESVGDQTLGVSRAIRSDEYLGLADIFDDVYKENRGNEDLFDTVTYYSNLEKVGFAILPLGNAFSFYSLFPYVFAFFFGYLFFRIFMKDSHVLPLVASFIVALAPEHVWWIGPGRTGRIFALVALFYYFFCVKKVYQKVLCAIGLGLTISWMVVTVYPAWDVPLVYLGLFATIAIFVKNKEVRFRKTDLIYIGATLAWLAFFGVCYTISQSEFVEATMNTVYPGMRFIAGGQIDPTYLIHYLAMPLTPYREISFLNLSEASSFITLFPFPFVFFVANFKQFRKNKIIVTLQGLALVMMVYMFIGFPDIIAGITLFSYSMEVRINTIFGLISTLLLIFQSYYYVREVPIKSKQFAVKTVCINASMAIILGAFLFSYRNVLNFLGITHAIVILTGVFMLINLVIFGYKKLFITVYLVVTLWCGAFVNPLNAGVDMMTSTPLAEEIRRIDEEDSGRWIVLGGTVLPKYVNAQGVECVNYLNYPPRFDLYAPLDPTGEYEDVYNRYAHVSLEIIEGETEFILNYGDAMTVKLSQDDIDVWDVKYIMSGEEFSLDTEELSTEFIYYDELDGLYIYKVVYK